MPHKGVSGLLWDPIRRSVALVRINGYMNVEFVRARVMYPPTNFILNSPKVQNNRLLHYELNAIYFYTNTLLLNKNYTYHLQSAYNHIIEKNLWLAAKKSNRIFLLPKQNFGHFIKTLINSIKVVLK